MNQTCPLCGNRPNDHGGTYCESMSCRLPLNNWPSVRQLKDRVAALEVASRKVATQCYGYSVDGTLKIDLSVMEELRSVLRCEQPPQAEEEQITRDWLLSIGGVVVEREPYMDFNEEAIVLWRYSHSDKVAGIGPALRFSFLHGHFVGCRLFGVAVHCSTKPDVVALCKPLGINF